MSSTALVAPADVAAAPRRAELEEAAIPSTTGARVAFCCVVLLLVYAALSFVIDVRGTLLADSGGKLATVKVMADRGTVSPDVGYWAADADPHGVLHPLRFTSEAHGEWIQATTLPMLYAAVPLYDLGGFRAVLLLPMIGAVLSALAARAIAQRLGGDRRAGWLAFWVVGLLTPVAVYALSFWEHTLGLAAMLWAVALALDAIDARSGALRFFAIGALFGIAASMRTEALVYFATTLLVVGVVLLRRRTSLRRLVLSGVAAVGGLALPVVGNELLERAVIGGGLRVARASGTVASSADALRERASGAVTSLVGINGFSGGSDPLIGAAIVLAMVGAIWLLSSRERVRVVTGVLLLAVVAVVFVARFATPAYLPGLLVASPLAAAGIGLAWSSSRLRTVAAMALLPLPLIWATQFLDTQRFQWGNRFALTSGALLAVVAVVVLVHRPRPALVGVLALSLVVTTCSILFLADQTRSIANGIPRLAAPRDALVVSTEVHLWREGGAFYDPGERWLAAGTGAELRAAARVADRHGLARMLVVSATGTSLPRSMGPYERVGVVEHLEVLPHGPLQVVEFRRV